MNASLLRSPMKAMKAPLLRSPMNNMNATSVALLRSPGEIIMSKRFKEKIQKGIRSQKACDEKDEYILGTLNGVCQEDFEESKRTAYECHKEPENEMTAFDDVTGSLLDPKRVKAARREEIDYVKNLGVYKKVPKSRC